MANAYSNFVAKAAELIAETSKNGQDIRLDEYFEVLHSHAAANNRLTLDHDSLQQIVHLGFRSVVHKIYLDAGAMNDLVRCAFSVNDECVSACLVFEEWSDCVSVSDLPHVFQCLQSHFQTLSVNISSSKGHGLSILRLCNELLRRLSKSKYSQFCGHVVLFICRLFPPYERSALNLRGEYNIDNFTTIDQFQISNDKIDFYTKFWSLQSVMHQSVVSLEVPQIQEVLATIDCVLSQWEVVLPVSNKRQAQYPKFLSNYELFDMQIVDGDFRATICIQLAIFLNQLLHFRSKFSQSFPDLDQKVCLLLNRMQDLQKSQSLDSTVIASQMEFLQSENVWASWKAQSCPSFERNVLEMWTNIQMRQLAQINALKLQLQSVLENSVISRLFCNLDESSDISASDYHSIISALIEQLAPDSGIEEEYLLSRNVEYRWSVLRAILLTPWVVDPLSMAKCDEASSLEEFVRNDTIAMQT